MDRQSITVDRSGFLHDMREVPIAPNVTRAENGWYKSQMPLLFDGAPVGKVVEQWLSKVRGALRAPDSRILIAGCMKKNVDPGGRLGLWTHPRIVWWESNGKSDNKRAAGQIPTRVAVSLKLRFCRHSLTNEIARQAEQRGIVDIPLLGPADAQKLVRFGLMDAIELERRLQPAIPPPIAKLMQHSSQRAIVTTQTLIDGQIHKLVQGDDVPAPLEPVRELPPIFDSNGEPMPRKEAQTEEAPVKKKRVIVNKPVGKVQRVLMQNERVALDRSLSYTERARQLIEKCREADLTKTSIASLALAIASFQQADDLAKAKAADEEATAANPLPNATEEPTEQAASAPANPPPAPASQSDSGAIGKVLSLVAQQDAQLKAAEDAVLLARMAQIEIAETVRGAIAEARGEARRALEQTLRTFGLS